MDHGGDADPDPAVRPAGYGSAGADDLDFGAGAEPDAVDPDDPDPDVGDPDGDPDIPEPEAADPPPPPSSQDVVTGSDDSPVPDQLQLAGYRMVAPDPGEAPGEGPPGGPELPDPLSTDAALAPPGGTDPAPEGAA